MKLYYHKTDGGAEYLCSNHLKNSDEGDVSNSYYVVRIDGDITKDAELTGKAKLVGCDCARCNDIPF